MITDEQLDSIIRFAPEQGALRELAIELKKSRTPPRLIWELETRHDHKIVARIPQLNGRQYGCNVEVSLHQASRYPTSLAYEARNIYSNFRNSLWEQIAPVEELEKFVSEVLK